MKAVDRALWFIEGHFADEITLDDVAAAAGLSRYHLSRAFGAATGRSVLRYVRSRRLTEAARMLSAGATDILTVALEAGYGSHEAFTRAFRVQFGLTPEQARRSPCLDQLSLVEPIRMDKMELLDVKLVRFEQGRPMLMAGLSARYTCETTQGIPALWQRFGPHIGHIDGQIGSVAYGVCYDQEDAGGFSYMAAVEVPRTDTLPDCFSHLHIPATRYAVFFHDDHVSTIKSTMHSIWNKWLPESGEEALRAPDLERYDERFDPMTGQGGFEIWIPLKG